MDCAFRTLESGSRQPLTTADLRDEFLQYAAGSYPVVWNLTDHQITPGVLKELFQKIAASSFELGGTFAVDLDANRLDRATEDDFKVVVDILSQPRFSRMCVRFGFEIFIPYLRKALTHAPMEAQLNERILFSSPWERQGRDLLALAVELRKSNSIAEQRIRELEASKKDAVQQLNAYRDTDDGLIEKGVTLAVAEKLEGGVIIFESRYRFRGMSGDLDGLVAGVLEGEEVIIFVEAKHNIDTMWWSAKKQVYAAVNYWELLGEMTWENMGQATEAEQRMKDDYDAMQVATYAGRKVMVAFGGKKFSDAVVEKEFKVVKFPWFKVVKHAGRYTVAEGPRQR